MATFTNQATLTYNGNSVNSNIVTGNLVDVLSITKTALDDIYTTGDDITYVISITNSGSTPVTALTVTDNLGAYTFNALTLVPLNYDAGSIAYYQNGVIQPTPTITTTSPLTIPNITVPANGNVILIYEVSTNEFAQLETGSTITNTVTATAESLPAPITADETITVSTNPDLTITKGISPSNVTPGGQLTYTFTIRNSGNEAATVDDGIVITDIFTPPLSDITVTVNSAVLPATSYTYNETTGEFSTTAGAITVPAATFSQSPDTGIVTITPGVTVVTVTGTI